LGDISGPRGKKGLFFTEKFSAFLPDGEEANAPPGKDSPIRDREALFLSGPSLLLSVEEEEKRMLLLDYFARKLGRKEKDRSQRGCVLPGIELFSQGRGPIGGVGESPQFLPASF